MQTSQTTFCRLNAQSDSFKDMEEGFLGIDYRYDKRKKLSLEGVGAIKLLGGGRLRARSRAKALAMP
jgi:hypothetical protein